MKKLLLASALILPLSLTGCIVVDGDNFDDYHDSRSDWQDHQRDNRRHISQLSPGMSYQQVRDLMGLADFNEFYEKDGAKVQVLYYRTHWRKGDGETTKDECTPLVIKDNQLVGWGETAYRMM